MPKWGLTEKQREARPWSLDPGVLRPQKVVTDPVHGDVYLNHLEVLFLDSPPMQRLRRVRQLGTTHLVYPAATHTRFSHALGTLRAAQDLLDAVIDNRNSPRPERDLFDEWSDVGEEQYTKRLSEAVVLARLGALLHDFCHVPLGHTIEDDLKVLDPHDSNGKRFEGLWNQVPGAARSSVENADPDLYRELRALILSKEDPPAVDASRYPFVADMVGNTICADLLDYIKRDHVFTGLPLALGHRFMNDFYVMGTEHVHYAKRMVVRITRQGQHRADIVSELVKYLRYRYELSERVLNHHTKIAADAMIGKLLEMWSDALWVEEARRAYPELVDSHGGGDIDNLQQAVREYEQGQGEDGDSQVKAIEAQVRDLLEEEFLRRSDDGLLEQLEMSSREMAAEDARRYGMAELAAGVLNRKLFKMIGRAEAAEDRALAKEKFEKWGSAEARRKLERQAAYYAGLGARWHVVLWIPHPPMRMKVAGVLVDTGASIAPLDRVDTASQEIVEHHRNLWGITVYAHPDVRHSPKQAEVLLSFMRDQMDIRLMTWDGSEVPTCEQLAVRRIGEEQRLSSNERHELGEAAVAAKGGDDTFAGLVRATWQAGVSKGFIKRQGPPPASLWS